ncbi:hypothetical protein ACFOWB_02185, partial [Chenggangzhangella methanolivorans]|uniref:hypothetical protein n=1 Tax=Chenggangzhangella methanolivorans TaxID=1437009 RepID=UPI00360D847D
MSDLSSAAFAFGVAATFLAATSAHAVDAAATPQAVALVSGGVAAKPADDPSLPKVEMAPAGESRRSDGAEATLDGLARDCANLGAETICKIALVGEGARRKAGAAAAIDAPMTIEVKDGDGRSIETRRISLKVEMPEGVQKVSFRHVEENVSLPPASAAGYGGWTIVVGLEPGDASVADAAGDDGEIEQVAPPPRAKSKRSRSARAKAVRQARTAAARQQPAQPAQPPVAVSTRPLAAPPTITTTTNGGPLARAAQGFTERRDTALQADR